MKWFFFIISLFLAVIFEATGMNIPWVLLVMLLSTIFTQKEWLFLVGIIIGCLLDSVTFRHLGETSLFLVCFLGFIFLYGRKFEMQSVGFVGGVAAIGSWVYALCFGLSNIVLVVVLATFFAAGGFLGMSSFFVKPEKW